MGNSFRPASNSISFLSLSAKRRGFQNLNLRIPDHTRAGTPTGHGAIWFSALASEARGCWFKSSCPDHFSVSGKLENSIMCVYDGNVESSLIIEYEFNL